MFFVLKSKYKTLEEELQDMESVKEHWRKEALASAQMVENLQIDYSNVNKLRHSVCDDLAKTQNALQEHAATIMRYLPWLCGDKQGTAYELTQYTPNAYWVVGYEYRGNIYYLYHTCSLTKSDAINKYTNDWKPKSKKEAKKIWRRARDKREYFIDRVVLVGVEDNIIDG